MVTSTLAGNDRQGGFSVQIGGSEARRQLRMSVGIVVVLAVTIVSAATTFGAHPVSAKRDIVSAAPLTTLHAETNVIGAKAI